MIQTLIYVMLSLIVPVISLPYILHHHVTMHETAVLDIKQGFPHCQVVVPRVARLPKIGPDRSVMLPEFVNHGLHVDQAKTPKTKTINRALQYVR